MQPIELPDCPDCYEEGHPLRMTPAEKQTGEDFYFPLHCEECGRVFPLSLLEELSY